MSSEVENIERISVDHLLLPQKMNLYGFHNRNQTKENDKLKIDPFKRHINEEFKLDINNISFQNSPKRMKVDDNNTNNVKKEISGLELLTFVALNVFKEDNIHINKKHQQYSSIKQTSSFDTDDYYSDNEDTRSVSKEDEYCPPSPSDYVNQHNSNSSSPTKMKTKKLKAGQHYSKKRHRTSIDQLKRLEEVYKTDKMPNQELRESLAKELGMTTRRVQIWFQNKRAKDKRLRLARESDMNNDLSKDNSIDSTNNSE